MLPFLRFFSKNIDSSVTDYWRRFTWRSFLIISIFDTGSLIFIFVLTLRVLIGSTNSLVLELLPLFLFLEVLTPMLILIVEVLVDIPLCQPLVM